MGSPRGLTDEQVNSKVLYCKALWRGSILLSPCSSQGDLEPPLCVNRKTHPPLPSLDADFVCQVVALPEV